MEKLAIYHQRDTVIYVYKMYNLITVGVNIGKLYKILGYMC